MNNPITTLSRERLELMTSDDIFPVASIGEVQEMARALLAVIDARIDAYSVRHHHEPQGTGTKIDVQDRAYYEQRGDYHYTPLYTTPPAPSAPEWSNEQCLEFLAVAFRHCSISGDIEMDDIRLGVKMANAAAPGGDE